MGGSSPTPRSQKGKIMYFDLDYDNHGHTHVEDDGTEWGRHEYASNEFVYKGITKAAREDWGEIALFPGEKEPSIGDSVFIVVVDYDTGDSFNNYTGCHEWEWAFTDPIKAEELAREITKNSEDESFAPFDFHGVPIEQATWKGYFECFNEALVEKLTFK